MKDAINALRTLQYRHNERDGVSNHQPHDCLLKRLFGHRSKKTSKLSFASLCAEISPVTGEFPAQRASNAENVSIWWRHHELLSTCHACTCLMHSADGGATCPVQYPHMNYEFSTISGNNFLFKLLSPIGSHVATCDLIQPYDVRTAEYHLSHILQAYFPYEWSLSPRQRNVND